MTDTLIYMASAFALKKLEKAGVISTSGLKKSKVKKYEGTYFVPIAYVGLLTLIDQKSTWKDLISFEGTLPFKTAIGNGEVYGWMQIETDRSNPTHPRDYSDMDYEMRQRAKDPNDIEAQTWMDNFTLRQENTSDFQKVTVKGGLEYTIVTDKDEEEVFKASRGRFASVEECLDYLEQIAQEGWSQVNIKVSDLSIELDAYNAMEDVLPKTISIDTSIGTMNMVDDYGDYKGTISQTNDDNIQVYITAKIKPVKDIDAPSYNGAYLTGTEMRERTVKPASYEIFVMGEITDYNTQVSVNIGTNQKDKWQRTFGREGALELSDAKDIIRQNCEEVITEWNEYTASARNYVEQRNGRGYQRTTVNTEPWDYNFGDTWEDTQYDAWQSDEYKDRVESDIKRVIDLDYSYAGPLFLYGSIKDNGDGTYTIPAKIGRTDIRYVENKELENEVKEDPEQYNQQVLDAFLANLRMNGYEILSVDDGPETETNYRGESFSILRADITVKPTVRKSKMIKTAIRKTYMNFVKALKKN